MMITFVTYNIQYSKGKDGRYDLERIADAVRGADVIALQEVTRNMAGVPEADQPAALGGLLADYFWIYGPPVDVDSGTRGSDGRPVNRRTQFGNMILSRFPILSSRLLLLPRNRSYDMPNTQSGALEGVVDLPSGPLRVYDVHLNSRNHAERILQIDDLLPWLFDHRRDGGALTGPVWLGGLGEVPMPEDFVVMGDCNFAPGSPEYCRMVGEPDYYHGTRVVAHHLVDSWTHVGNAIDQGVTWHDETDDWQTRLRLDYGFVSAGLAAQLAAARIDEDAAGSDHQPYWFDLDTG